MIKSHQTERTLLQWDRKEEQWFQFILEMHGGNEFSLNIQLGKKLLWKNRSKSFQGR